MPGGIERSRRGAARLGLSLAALALAASFAARGATVARTVPPSDGAESFDNPGCGYAGGGWSNLTPDMQPGGVDLCRSSANCTKLWSMHKFSNG